mmetsp:Transcript_9728/g.31654  ORF Transcript_9728/g.31654 Transcript_9728/m.31654 type:complete len:336 (-) Transcript_9728:202-1209(-)
MGTMIMPDGRTLGEVLRLHDETMNPPRRKRTNAKRGGGARARLQEAMMDHTAFGLRETEADLLTAVSRVGSRRRRQALNDKLLRDLAGPIDTSEVPVLFNPVPFGVQMESALAKAAQPENEPLWDPFRQIDMDKQARVLQRAERRARKEGVEAGKLPADPHAAWRGVPRTLRRCLKRAAEVAPHFLEEIEDELHGLMGAEYKDGVEGGGEELVLQLDDNFQRMISHGLCRFHRLLSASRFEGATRVTLVRRRPCHAAVATGAAGGPWALRCTPLLVAAVAGRGEEGEGGLDAGGFVTDAPTDIEDDYEMVDMEDASDGPVPEGFLVTSRIFEVSG